MRRVKLDRIDQRILQDLQENGRISNVDLARRAGISAPPCLRRVRALERAGYLRGYHADLEPKALGFNVTVFAQVGLASRLTPAPNVTHVKSALSTRTSKLEPGVPFPLVAGDNGS